MTKTTVTIRSLFSDIRFWIIVFGLIRLVGITHPPIDISHGWRQSYTAMVARNFFEEGPDLLYPKVDHMGPDREVTASEFPFYNYLIYLFSVLFGYEHWYGRIINLIVSSLGVWSFFQIVRMIAGHRTAFFSSLVLLSSIWFAFSRKIMPDTFSVSLVLTGLYFAFVFLKGGRYLNLLPFLVLTSLGVLAKLPSVLLLAFLVIPLLHDRDWKRLAVIAMITVVALVSPAIWYFYWVPHLVEKFNNPLFFPRSLLSGAAELAGSSAGMLEKFYFSAFQSYVSFIIFLVGLILMIRYREKALSVVFLVSLLMFIVFMLKAGIIFSRHNYYIIPLVPSMALVAGFALSKIRLRWVAVTILLIAMTEGVLNQLYDLRMPEDKTYLLELQDIADKYSPEQDLFIVNSGLDPQLIYFLHRKGWSVDPADACSDTVIGDLRKKGATFLLLDKHLGECSLDYPQAYESKDVVIYRLD